MHNNCKIKQTRIVINNTGTLSDDLINKKVLHTNSFDDQKISTIVIDVWSIIELLGNKLVNIPSIFAMWDNLRYLPSPQFADKFFVEPKRKIL